MQQTGQTINKLLTCFASCPFSQHPWCKLRPYLKFVQPFLAIFILLMLKVPFFDENSRFYHYHIAQNTNTASSTHLKLLYKSLITTFSFLQCLTNSQAYLTSAISIYLQHSFFCFLINTVTGPTSQILPNVRTDTPLSSFSNSLLYG